MRLPTLAGAAYHSSRAARWLRGRNMSWLRGRSIQALNDLLPGRPSVELYGRVSFRAKLEGVTRNIRIRAGALVREHAWLNCLDRESSIEIGSGTVINPYAKLVAASGAIKIGRDCSVHSFDVLYGFSGGLIIGNHVRIAVNVVLVNSDYCFDDLTKPVCGQGSTSLGITIGDHVWIGAGAIIVDGVTVGSNSVIGAGSVVTKNVPENSICVGVPGRCIRRRGERPPTESAAATADISSPLSTRSQP